MISDVINHHASAQWILL